MKHVMDWNKYNKRKENFQRAMEIEYKKLESLFGNNTFKYISDASSTTILGQDIDYIWIKYRVK